MNTGKKMGKWMQQFKAFLKSNKFYLIILTLITILGVFLRMKGLNKPDGLWYDEALSFSIAKESFPMGILDRLYNEEYHAPLYYFFLHFWMMLVNYNDLLIRISSIIFGVINIPVFYLCGKNLNSRKVGLIAATLASINSFLIYYSQEVRFYSLLILLSSLCTLFIIRLRNDFSRIDLIGLAVCNICILYIYSFGFVFVGIQALTFATYLLFKQRENLKPFIVSLLITLGCYLPYLPTVYHFTVNNSKSLAGNFWWLSFAPASPFLVLQDWFSPILINLRSHPINYYSDLLSTGGYLPFIIFVLFPAGVYFYGITKAVSKKDFSLVVFLVGALFFLAEIILAANGKMGLMTRYTVLAFPPLLVTAAYGLSLIKKRRTKIATLGLMLLVNLFFLHFSPISASVMPRDGYKKYEVEIEKQGLNKDELIIIPYGARFFDEYYLNKKAQVVPFDIEYLYVLNKGLETALPQELIEKVSSDKLSNYVSMRSFISSSDESLPFEKYLQENVIDRLKPGKRVAVVMSGGIDAYDSNTLQKIAYNDMYYIGTPLFPMLSSKTINDMFKVLNKNLIPVSKEDKDGWQLYIYKKGGN